MGHATAGLDLAMKKALITGITGQDGSYLAEFLLAKGYEVHGTLRGVAFEDPVRRMWRIRQIRDRIHLHACSIESQARLFQVVAEVRPDECYHLAAHSFVNYSFDDEPATINSAINGTQCMLSAIRELVPRCRFYFATSSEMFGNAPCSPQNEDTPFNPRAPYGIGKVAGYHLTRHYREVYGLAACNGILFNHESERRGREFVTPQDHERRGQPQGRPDQRVSPRQPRRPARLGLRPGVRGGHVAHAAGARGRRLCRRHRRVA